MIHPLREKEILSNTIETLRFPLAIAVIFIHMNPNVVSILNTNFDLLTYKGVLNLLEITFSHILPRIAVPCFF